MVQNESRIENSHKDGVTKPKTAPHDKAAEFYNEVLKLLLDSKIPFLVGGTNAVIAYTGIRRDTKDLDVFCRAGDQSKILDHFSQKGYKIAVKDERWLARIEKGKYFCDTIFGLANALIPINDEWFRDKKYTAELFGRKVPLLSPTELIWAKAMVQDRHKYDMADVMHVILFKYKDIDWKRLLSHMEPYWEILFIIVINFRFVYPSERERIPRWILDELLERLKRHLHMPTPDKKICRGRLVSRGDYEVDVKEFGFEDIGS